MRAPKDPAPRRGTIFHVIHWSWHNVMCTLFCAIVNYNQVSAMLIVNGALKTRLSCCFSPCPISFFGGRGSGVRLFNALTPFKALILINSMAKV